MLRGTVGLCPGEQTACVTAHSFSRAMWTGNFKQRDSQRAGFSRAFEPDERALIHHVQLLKQCLFLVEVCLHQRQFLELRGGEK